MGSLNIPDLYLEKSILQIKMVFTFLNTPNLSDLLQNTIDIYQLYSGYPGDILSNPKVCTYTNSVWIKSLLELMVKYNIKIHRVKQFDIPKQRKNDEPIMKVFSKMCHTPLQLEHINLCRKYLKTIFMPDIISPDGYTINNKTKQQT